MSRPSDCDGRLQLPARWRSTGVEAYELVNGWHTLEAYIALDQAEIPTFVVEATREECIRSLEGVPQRAGILEITA